MLKVIGGLAFLYAGVVSAGPSGERLAYLVGCINCHHQTPKEIINAPPLAIVQAYSLPEFKKLMKVGVTRVGRDMLAQSSIMGIVAKEQFSHFTDEEVAAVYNYLRTGWTAERAAKEETKIPSLYKAEPEKK
ncbi:MAG: cytochrome c [Xanthomonadales bacterium]|nr:cytochrome c [Xanthomonadales bacterium]